jgi:ankyrin repeat protein
MTALHHATMSGYEDTVCEILAREPDYDAVANNLSTPAFIAVLKGRENIFNLLLGRRATLQVTPGPLGSIAHAACVGGSRSIFQTLLERKVPFQNSSRINYPLLLKFCPPPFDPESNMVQTWECIPAHLAVAFRHPDILQKLLEAGTSVNAKSSLTFRTSKGESETRGHSLLHEAVYSNARNLVEVLFMAGADLDARTFPQGSTAIMSAARMGRFETLRSLVSTQACREQTYLDVGDEQGDTAMMWAAMGGYIGCVRFLLDQGAAIDQRNQVGNTALVYAAICGHAGCLDLLLDRHADVNSQNRNGRNAVHYAARHGHRQCMQLLIDDDASFDIADEDGNTPLLDAAKAGHEDCVDLLLHYGASVDHRNKAGCTPLYMAAEQGYAACISLLVSAGADINSKGGEFGGTALMAASAQRQSSGVETLLDFNADVNERSLVGRTALHYAAQWSHVESVKKLVKAGANVNVADFQNDTPLDAMEWNRQGEHFAEIDQQRCQQYLQRQGAKRGKRKR